MHTTNEFCIIFCVQGFFNYPSSVTVNESVKTKIMVPDLSMLLLQFKLKNMIYRNG